MISVFTPSFNRAYILTQLYKSLCRQTCQDFEWIVVNDGSSDNTDTLIKQFQEENKISIRYFYIENSGKHIAINKGLSEALGEWFFIVDSDDYLEDNAIEIISNISHEINNNSDFVGLSGVRMSFDGKRIGGRFPIQVIDSDAIKIRTVHKIKGDLAEVYKTDIIKKYTFPAFPNEKFLTEAYIWLKLAADGYKIRYTSHGFYKCEYRSDGLTAKMTRLRRENPIGATSFYSEYIKLGIPFTEKCKSAINYWRFYPCLVANSEYSKPRINKIWNIFRPIGYIMYLRDNKNE